MLVNYFENKFFRLKNKLTNLTVKIAIVYSRYMAISYRRDLIRRNGTAVVTREIKKSIKEYARQRFGKKAYWPYLALYTEIRGKFIKGWIPYDYYRYILFPVMNREAYRYLSDHKTFDYKLFGDFAVKPLFIYILGIYYDADFKKAELSQVKKLLSEYDNVIVVKEECGMKGKQISIVHSSEFNPEMLRRNINYVIQPYVKQYKILADLYPDSVNTFRVMTYLKSDGTVSVKFVILRFGVNGIKVDNLSSGGQYIYFDFAGNPSSFAYDFTYSSPIGDRHRNTGYLFSDLKIPMFKNVLDTCITAHKKYPYLRVIGWDVCIDESGEPKLIEWNAYNPGILRYEALFGPMWANDDDI